MNEKEIEKKCGGDAMTNPFPFDHIDRPAGYWKSMSSFEKVVTRLEALALLHGLLASSNETHQREQRIAACRALIGQIDAAAPLTKQEKRLTKKLMDIVPPSSQAGSMN